MEDVDTLDYQVRISKKAKRPQITYTSTKGVEVVVPEKFDFNIKQFIDTHKTWISKQISKNQPKQEFYFPSEISIEFLQRKYQITYMASKGVCKYIERPDFSLVVLGDIIETKFKKIIKQWLFKLAQENLLGYLETLSQEINLDYRDASIRGQLTIWGSCSAKKDISVNYKLLFLPKHLARYVLIHELCHTIHLDHSQRFWRLVRKFDNNYLEHKKELAMHAKLNFNWLD